jgi:hypothetical protein
MEVRRFLHGGSWWCPPPEVLSVPYGLYDRLVGEPPVHHRVLMIYAIRTPLPRLLLVIAFSHVAPPQRSKNVPLMQRDAINRQGRCAREARAQDNLLSLSTGGSTSLCTDPSESTLHLCPPTVRTMCRGRWLTNLSTACSDAKRGIRLDPKGGFA